MNEIVFSQDMIFLSSVSVPGVLWDITMMKDMEAVVTEGKSLVILDVSDRQLRIKHTIDLSFYGRGITNIKDKLIVAASGGVVGYPTVRVLRVHLTVALTAMQANNKNFIQSQKLYLSEDRMESKINNIVSKIYLQKNGNR